MKSYKPNGGHRGVSWDRFFERIFLGKVRIEMAPQSRRTRIEIRNLESSRNRFWLVWWAVTTSNSYRVHDEMYFQAVLSSEGHAAGFALELFLLQIWNFPNDYGGHLNSPPNKLARKWLKNFKLKDCNLNRYEPHACPDGGLWDGVLAWILSRRSCN